MTDADLARYETRFPVPASHKRFAALKEYLYRVAPVENALDGAADVVLCDAFLQSLPWLTSALAGKRVVWLTPSENETKERGWLERFLVEQNLAGVHEIVAIGGGIVINAASYLAERLACDLVYVPTTVLAMADAAISGKVRANIVEGDVCRKHAYKSYWEPNLVVLDPRFLDGLPESQITVGMGEIVKHGVYQSKTFLEYLANDTFDPFADRHALLKSIVWTVELCAVCYTVDPEETPEGGGCVMRGAHDASDKIEEQTCFAIPHGTAVAIAMFQEKQQERSPLLPLLEIVYPKMRMSTSI